MSIQLHQLVYVSRSEVELNLSIVESISSQAQISNKKNNVTGLLVFRAGYFLQLLEGDKFDVHFTFKKIRDDKRHKNLRVLIDKPVDARIFPGWNMNSRDLSIVDTDILEKVTHLLENEKVQSSPVELLNALWSFYST